MSPNYGTPAEQDTFIIRAHGTWLYPTNMVFQGHGSIIIIIIIIIIIVIILYSQVWCYFLVKLFQVISLFSAMPQ